MATNGLCEILKIENVPPDSPKTKSGNSDGDVRRDFAIGAGLGLDDLDDHRGHCLD